LIYLRSYFQFRDFPAPIHSTACASRRARVSALFASVIHSMYSRLWLGENASNAACAFLSVLQRRREI
jgi:hypothetical protein